MCQYFTKKKPLIISAGFDSSKAKACYRKTMPCWCNCSTAVKIVVSQQKELLDSR